MSKCCKNCVDRQVNCHAHCEKYKEYKEELKRIEANRREANKWRDGIREAAERTMKSKNPSKLMRSPKR